MQKHTLRRGSAGVVAGLLLLSLPVCASKQHLPDPSALASQATTASTPAPGEGLLPGSKGGPLTKVYFPPLLPAGATPALQPVAPDKRSASGDSRAQASVQRPGIVYIAQKGDTLRSVARKLGVGVKTLAHLNDFNTTKKKLQPGQTLRVPETQSRSLPNRGGPPPFWGSGYGRPELVDSALQYRGVPYRWAGTTSRGMDCSGLVKRVLQSQGVNAPHNAAQLYGLGVPVESGDLQSGDLVFFGNTYRKGVSHVGIYVGEGQFIHASSGRGVVISGLSERYYRAHYVGARRVR